MIKSLLAAAVMLTAFAGSAALATSAEDAAPRYTLDTPLAELMADPEAKAVIDEVLPGLTTIPEIEMIKPLSLRQIAPFSEGKLTDELLATVEDRLAEIA